MKICNTSACETCESFGFQNFKILEFPCGKIDRPKKKADRLIFIISGRLSVIAEGQEFFCEVGQLILFTRDKTYEVNALEDTKELILSFVTIYQICDKMELRDVKDILDSIRYQFCSLPIKKPMELMLESVFNYLKDDITCGYWQRAKQIELFVLFWNYYTLEDICRFFYPLINKEIGFHTKVMANCTKAKTVSRLAELCGYSLTTFNKLFTAHFEHSTPYQWMLQQNAPLIKAKLFDKTVPIKVIIAEFGFIDHPHFNKYCKRYFGATASQIRRGND